MSITLKRKKIDTDIQEQQPTTHGLVFYQECEVTACTLYSFNQVKKGRNHSQLKRQRNIES